ncbi:methionine/alanine import family NSS transporter small subunit [Phytoactinopolyspora endophytica]|nr:methionine/alanine import family NSS transporter small subunit [Phytoactinopolyspora endophytica]
MSAGAVVMMIVTIAIVWGGLVAGVLYLRRHPDEVEDESETGL